MKFSFDEVALGTIANFSYGYTETALNQGDIRFIRITDIDERGNLKEANARYINISDGIDKYTVKKGDLLVARTGGTFGKTLYYNSDILSVYASFLIKINVDNSFLLPEFYFHFSQSNKYWFQAKNLVTGGGQPQFNANVLKEIVVPLPPLPEQKAIADLLFTWDKAIEKTERLIQAKEKRLRQTAIWLLFGHRRLNNKSVELTDSHFFKYPCDWKLVKISRIAKEISERNGKSQETVLSCSKYDGFVNSLDYFGKQVFSSDTSNYKVIKKGQFGYPSNHVEEGSIGLLDHCEKGIVSPIYVVFEASKNKIHPLYLFKLLKTDIYQHIFQVSTSSSVDRRGSLRWGKFSKIKVPLPPLKEQQQIAETLSTIQQEIDLLKHLAEKYKTQKRGLMQKLLTGEWRIKPEILNKYKEALLWRKVKTSMS
ncbi:MAG: restriction endonuclease subunit S [Deltaproteobacteria bacterium]|nr:restriction endonuclease subunit S [Deltaproteobacteria bacterium]